MKARFGPGGFPPSFYESEYRLSKYGKHREGIFPWLASLGLNYLELECTYGIRMPHDQASNYARVASDNGIGLSIHAPYYCVLCSSNRETVIRSRQDILRSFELASILGADRICFHPGYPCRKDIKVSLDMIIESLLIVGRHRPDNVFVCPEIGGKVNQLGSPDDLIYICKHVDYARPCLDLAHLHAREGSSLTSVDAIVDHLNYVEQELGRSRLEESYYHVYQVSTNHLGEKEHLTFDDDSGYYPKAKHFIRSMRVKDLVPTVICEASRSQEQGAVLMKKLYWEDR